MTTSSANLDAQDRSRGHVRDVSPSAPSARVWDDAVAEGVSALLESDAMTGNDESPTHYYVDAENVAYLVRTVLTAAADAVESAIRAEALAEIDGLKKIIASYEHRIMWDTTCENCANVLDKSIAEFERAETLEATLAAVAALADKLAAHGNPDESRESIKLRHALMVQLRAVLGDPEAGKS